MAVATLFGLASMPAQAENSVLGLDISVSRQHYDQGSPVELTMTVTNRGNEPCQLAESATGTVRVLSVKRDDATLAPSFARGRFTSGFSTTVRRSLKSVPPGGFVRLQLISARTDQAAESTALQTDDPLLGGESLAALWTIGQSGRYTVSVQYSLPAIGGDGKLCTGLTNVATVTFSVGDTGSDHRLTWILIIAGAVLLGLVLVLAIWRSGRITAAAIMVLAAVASLAGVNAPRADAAIVYPPKPVDWDDKKFSKWMDEITNCFGLFGDPSLGDPAGIIKQVTDPKTAGVYITPTDGDTK
jgi:hypothetical protein